MPEPVKPGATKDGEGKATLTVEELTEKLKANETTLAESTKRAETAEGKLSDSEKKLQDEIYTPDYLQFLSEKENKGKATPPPDDKNVDFEKMNIGEVVAHIKKDVNKAISASQEATQVNVTKLGRMVEGLIVSGDVDKAAGKYADFYDYRQNMAELSKKNPQLGAESLYKLAKFGKIEDDIKKKGAAAPDEHKKPEDISKKEFKTTEEAATAVAEDLGL